VPVRGITADQLDRIPLQCIRARKGYIYSTICNSKASPSSLPNARFLAMAAPSSASALVRPVPLASPPVFDRYALFLEGQRYGRAIRQLTLHLYSAY
jgi:hypothetical protein